MTASTDQRQKVRARRCADMESDGRVSAIQNGTNTKIAGPVPAVYSGKFFIGPHMAGLIVRNGACHLMNPSPGPANERKTILVVDDDPEVLAFISHLLSDDYNVLLATCALEGLDRAVQYTGAIDLLVTDFQMPGMSGLGLAAQIAHERPGAAIVIMSGIAVEAEMLNDGWHFLAKPFLPPQLLSLIAGLVSREPPESKAASTGSH